MTGPFWGIVVLYLGGLATGALFWRRQGASALWTFVAGWTLSSALAAYAALGKSYFPVIEVLNHLFAFLGPWLRVG